MHSTHIKTIRERNTIILLDVYKLCLHFIIRKPRPQASAIDVTLNRMWQNCIMRLISCPYDEGYFCYCAPIVKDFT